MNDPTKEALERLQHGPLVIGRAFRKLGDRKWQVHPHIAKSLVRQGIARIEHPDRHGPKVLVLV